MTRPSLCVEFARTSHPVTELETKFGGYTRMVAAELVAPEPLDRSAHDLHTATVRDSGAGIATFHQHDGCTLNVHKSTCFFHGSGTNPFGNGSGRRCASPGRGSGSTPCASRFLRES